MSDCYLGSFRGAHLGMHPITRLQGALPFFYFLSLYQFNPLFPYVHLQGRSRWGHLKIIQNPVKPISWTTCILLKL